MNNPQSLACLCGSASPARAIPGQSFLLRATGRRPSRAGRVCGRWPPTALVSPTFLATGLRAGRVIPLPGGRPSTCYPGLADGQGFSRKADPHQSRARRMAGHFIEMEATRRLPFFPPIKKGVDGPIPITAAEMRYSSRYFAQPRRPLPRQSRHDDLDWGALLRPIGHVQLSGPKHKMAPHCLARLRRCQSARNSPRVAELRAPYPSHLANPSPQKVPAGLATRRE